MGGGRERGRSIRRAAACEQRKRDRLGRFSKRAVPSESANHRNVDPGVRGAEPILLHARSLRQLSRR